jgi:hypothetical protein
MLLGLVSTLVLSGCESEEDRKVAAAQECLDQATTEAQANICVEKVSGLTSSYSYLIRCSANFIAQGFTGNNIASAFDGITNQDNGGGDANNSTTVLMTYLVFDPDKPNHTIDKTIENCEKSGVESMMRLSTVASLATKIADLGSVLDNFPTDPTQAQQAIQDAIDNLAATPVNPDEIGAIAEQAADSFCSEGSSYKGTEICTTLEGAISGGGGDQAQIGQALLDLLKTPSP